MKLLVNTPNGTQEVIVVGEGGGYFDPDRVIWDERLDGELPEITLGGMVRVVVVTPGDPVILEDGTELPQEVSTGHLEFDQAVMDAHLEAAKPPVPQVVTMRQARLALLGAGKLAAVNAAIAAMPGAQGEAARIEWEFSNDVNRKQPLVLAMGPALGMTAKQLDALFTAAATL